MPVILKTIKDAELRKLRALVADEPVRHGLIGIALVLEPLYDDIIKAKADKNLTWSEMAELFTKWGYPVKVSTMRNALRRISKERAAGLATPRKRGRRKTNVTTVRRTGSGDEGKQQLELVTHVVDSESTLNPANDRNTMNAIVGHTDAAPTARKPETGAAETDKTPARGPRTPFRNNPSATIIRKT